MYHTLNWYHCSFSSFSSFFPSCTVEAIENQVRSHVEIHKRYRNNSHQSLGRWDVDHYKGSCRWVNGILHKIDQRQATNCAIIMTAMYLILKRVSILRIIVVKISGNIEYPRIESDWKKLIFPPMTLMLKVVKLDPIRRILTITRNLSSAEYQNSYFRWWAKRGCLGGTVPKDPSFSGSWPSPLHSLGTALARIWMRLLWTANQRWCPHLPRGESREFVWVIRLERRILRRGWVCRPCCRDRCERRRWVGPRLSFKFDIFVLGDYFNLRFFHINEYRWPFCSFRLFQSDKKAPYLKIFDKIS